MPSKRNKSKGIEEWEARDALRTIVRAEEIKQNKKLMQAVKPLLEEEQKAMLSAAEILYGKNKQGEVQ